MGLGHIHETRILRKCHSQKFSKILAILIQILSNIKDPNFFQTRILQLRVFENHFGRKTMLMCTRPCTYSMIFYCMHLFHKGNAPSTTKSFKTVANNITHLSAVNIEEMKEIRRGCSSRDFQRQPDLLKRIDPNCCFVVVYGNGFKLKTLSCMGK